MGLKPKLLWAGKKTGPNPTDRGKRGVKRSLATDARGVPLSVDIEGANVHDICLTGMTLLQIEDRAIKRPRPTGKAPQGLCLDKGYDSQEVRNLAQLFGFVTHLRTRGEERHAKRTAGKRARRWVVERTHGWLNRFRRLLIRWEKKPEHYLAMLHLACGLIAYQQAFSG
jgi:putative transposase